MHEIDIYGDIVAFKYYNDGSEYDLRDLKNALSNLSIIEGETLTVNIHTYGGDTTTAFAMYNLLKRFKSDNKISLRTRVDGYCASSGVILLLAGDVENRIGSKYLKPFVHNAWTWSFGIDKNEAQRIYEDLNTVDNEIAELYSEETSITKDVALQFMNESRDLTITECKDYGFYSELENVRVIENSAVFNSIISRNIQNRKSNLINTMSKESEKPNKGLRNKIQNFLDGILGIKNKIMFTATNGELDFYELTEEDSPSVGDKATYDGKPAGDSNNGEYLMQSGETFKFEGEELKEIVPKTEDSNDSVSIEEVQAENETLKTEITNLKKQLKTEKQNSVNLSAKLNNATSIIKEFNDSYESEFKDEEETEGKDPKQKIDNRKESRVKSALKNLRKTDK